MEAGGLTVSKVPACNWAAPWLQPYQAVGQAIEREWHSGLPLPQALSHAPSAPVRFVPQADLPVNQAYEEYIFHSGCCPTREGLHDFFNGLCWLHFPATKRRLNQLQAAQIKTAGIQPVRGLVRDALTLFDENAAILQAPPALWEALIAKDWQRLFVTLRPLWQEVQLLLFGHALLEKLVSPRKPMVAHVYRATEAMKTGVNGGFDLAALDAGLAVDLTAEYLATKPFTPLPVLGVPGWWAANEATVFYEDAAVFRSAKTARATASPTLIPSTPADKIPPA